MLFFFCIENLHFLLGARKRCSFSLPKTPRARNAPNAVLVGAFRARSKDYNFFFFVKLNCYLPLSNFK